MKLLVVMELRETVLTVLCEVSLKLVGGASLCGWRLAKGLVGYWYVGGFRKSG